jgi:hypothetical protein
MPEERTPQQHYELPDDEYIENQIEYLETCAKDFFDTVDFPYEKLKTNIKTIEEIVIRVHKRMKYFIYFHNNMELNEYKIVALYVYWILKLRPYWIDISGEDEETIVFSTRINEKISLHAFLSIIREYNKLFFEKGNDLIKDYSEELLYSFRHRDISKEAMYLMLDPFYYMYYFNKSVDSEGNPIL